VSLPRNPRRTTGADPDVYDRAMGTPVDWPTWVTTSVSAAPAPGEFPKFGIGAFSEAVRQEVLGQRVRVGLVEPGTVQTEITTALPPEGQAALENRTAGMVNLNLPTSPMPWFTW
jgi:NAD(P)-dependent dehydrogenase (short-subunit alcohol dehydrogenase family)